MRRLGKIGFMALTVFVPLFVLSTQQSAALSDCSPVLTVPLDFSGTQYADCFADQLRGGDIVSQVACPPGPGGQPADCRFDLGPTGHTAVNMIGATAAGRLTWLTNFVPNGNQALYSNSTTCVDVALFRNDGDKGGGVAALLGGGSLGLALVMTDAGYDDRLQLLTVNPVTGATAVIAQAKYPAILYNARDDHGQTDGQAFCGLYYAANGPSFHNNCDWTRVCMTVEIGVASSLIVNGSVTRHVPPDLTKPKHMPDPNAPLQSVPMGTVHFEGKIPGVGTLGESGIIATGNQVYLTASFTNFWVHGDVSLPPPPPCTVCPCPP